MYRHLSLEGVKAIAHTIRWATHDVNRNRMVILDKRHGGIRNITRFLVAAGVMTEKERRNAIATLPRIKNPSVRT